MLLPVPALDAAGRAAAAVVEALSEPQQFRLRSAEELQEHDAGAEDRGQRQGEDASPHHQRSLRDPPESRARVLPQPEAEQAERPQDSRLLHPHSLQGHWGGLLGRSEQSVLGGVHRQRLEHYPDGRQAEEEVILMEEWYLFQLLGRPA